MTKPIIGQSDWGQVLNDHLDIVEGKADGAETPAGAQAKADAAEANAKAASIPTASREAASGVAGLDALGKVFESRLPDRLSDTTLAASSTADRDRANHTGTQPASTVTGLGDAATKNVGTTAGTVAAGDDSRFGAGGNAGVRRRGYSVPKGALDRWDAYIRTAAHASSQRDVVCFGDSTTEGILNSGANGAGYVPKLRDLAVAAGITDGGRGIINGPYETATTSGENFAGWISTTGMTGATTNTPPGPAGWVNSTGAAGGVVTLQYKAPSNALRIRSSSNDSTGRLTVAVGGVVVGTIDPWVAKKSDGSKGTYGQVTKVFTGLPAGGTGQTVTVTNTGGAPIPDPFQFRTAGSASTGGAVAPGTYTYAATFVDATGKETALSPRANQTVPAGTNTNTVTTALDNNDGNVPAGLTKVRLYRATGGNVTDPASFQMVLEVNTAGGGQVVLTDVGNTPGAAPPATSQGPFSDPANGGPKNAAFTADFFDSTKGVTFHRAGYSGQKYPLLFTPSNSTHATAAYDAQTHLGLTPGLGVGLDWTAEPAPRPDARNPVLAISAFGINDLNTLDLTSATTIAAGLQAITNGVAQFIRLARAAGCDPLVIIPHLEYAADIPKAGQIGTVRAAIVNAADAHGCAWFDFSDAYGPRTAASGALYGGVHSTQAGYDAQATALWDNLLSPVAAR